MYTTDQYPAADRSYLGQGLGFPLRTSLQGGIATAAQARKVSESIWIILRTSVGERVYRPTFGSRLSELTFAPLNTHTLFMIRMHVREALEAWEPRIILEEVSTEADPIEGKVYITIRYYLKDSPDLLSLVYPFYLAAAE
jgi:uncharacterized protein